MAQAVQIVPKFQHSHVGIITNDYTQQTESESSVVDSNVKYIAVFRSGMGIDNVLVKQNSLSDFKKTYGNSDYAKYGQPLMMPLAMLGAGNATVYCMRIMPEDARYANSILSLLYKTDETTGQFMIKFESSYVTDAVSKKDLRTKAASLKTTTEDANGYIRVPIGTFRMMGRGVYGNTYRWRIARNTDYETDYNIKMYSFEALSTTNGLAKVATYVGGLVTSPKYDTTTLINDVLDDTEAGAAVIDVQFFEENVEEVYNKFVEFVEGLDEAVQDDIPDLDEFDPLFGISANTNVCNANIKIVTDEEGCITVDNAVGITLCGGSDGVFASANPQEVYAAEIKCYQDAFEGNLDKHILAARRTPCNALFDANYPMEVKQSLAALANLRESCLLYLDAGLVYSFENIDDMIKEYAGFNTRNISKDFQHYTVKDLVTKKRVEVTMTYFYAQQLASHIKENGSHVPFVKSRAQLSGHIKNTLVPSIELEDTDIKEKLYLNRFNYFEAIDENTFQRGCQNTAQMISSDLLEENNMNTLYELKSIIERDCWNSLYDFTSAEDRARFQESEKAKFSDWEGRKLATFSIKFDVSAFEAERSIVHCYIEVTFRTLNKRTIIEIDVNKRDFTA